MPVAAAASRTMSLAWRFVPTNRMFPPLATAFSMKAHAFSRASWVLARSMIVTPWRWSKTKGFERGFQRFVWCPKCTPASSRSFGVMLMLMRIYVSDLYTGRPKRAALRSRLLLTLDWLRLTEGPKHRLRRRLASAKCPGSPAGIARPGWTGGLGHPGG